MVEAFHWSIMAAKVQLTKAEVKSQFRCVKSPEQLFTTSLQPAPLTFGPTDSIDKKGQPRNHKDMVINMAELGHSQAGPCGEQ